MQARTIEASPGQQAVHSIATFIVEKFRWTRIIHVRTARNGRGLVRGDGLDCSETPTIQNIFTIMSSLPVSIIRTVELLSVEFSKVYCISITILLSPSKPPAPILLEVI